LLIGPETAMCVAGQFPLQDLGEMELKGRLQPLQVYEVLQQAKTGEEDQVIEL
jgi:hypothetical protein